MSLHDNDLTRRLAEAVVHATDAASRAHFDRVAAEQRALDAQAALSVLENSFSFRLGAALVGAKSWQGLRALPRRLVHVLRTGRSAATPMPPRRGVVIPPPWQPEAGLLESVRSEVPPPATLGDLRIVAVLDQFSERVLAPDCNLVSLPAEGFEETLDRFAPHILLVESAWRGRDGAWRDLLSPVSGKLLHLLDCCRRRGIPTVFWNKEDPTHFDHFLPTAMQFDHVLTTDSACLARYALALGRERIGTLGFACQPVLHHPVESRDRERAACFAGSWYQAYPERCLAFEALVAQVGAVMPVAIYDRNHNRDDPCFAFPRQYRPMIKGHVDYDGIAEVYKAYEYAITVNSVLGSPTMVARRVYELLACNTVVASNPTEGMAAMFPGIVVGAIATEDVGAELRRLVERPIEKDRRRVKGLRAVMSRHTAAHRLHELCASVLGLDLAMPVAGITVAARVRTRPEAASVAQAYLRQTWARKRLVLVLADAAIGFDVGGIEGALAVDEGIARAVSGEGTQWLAVMHPADHYGSRYLEDLALATLYAPAEARIGKSQRFRARDGKCIEAPDAPAYRAGGTLSRRAMIERWHEPRLAALAVSIERMEGETQPDVEGLVVDGFEYCREGAGIAEGAVDV